MNMMLKRNSRRPPGTRISIYLCPTLEPHGDEMTTKEKGYYSQSPKIPPKALLWKAVGVDQALSVDPERRHGMNPKRSTLGKSRGSNRQIERWPQRKAHLVKTCHPTTKNF